MNWFDILKNAGLAQRQRQGISARQKDEDFVFEDEDEDDCYNEFLDLIDKVASFPNSAINRVGKSKIRKQNLSMMISL